MKFHDLDIGQRFELDGVVYVKTSPVLAGQTEGGGSKFMPRYAMVKLLDAAAPRVKAESEKMLPAEVVRVAFEAYHARCRGVIEAALPADRLQQVAGVLEGERKGFLDALLKR